MHLLWPIPAMLPSSTIQRTRSVPTPNLYSTNPTVFATFQTQLHEPGTVSYLQRILTP